ncbi:hypothetical protein XENOCAPTIV_014755, partial [Xenoophorus captivus]
MKCFKISLSLKLIFTLYRIPACEGNVNENTSDFVSPQLKEAAGAETISETSLSPGLSTVSGQSEKALSQGQYRCLEPSRRDAQENRTGLFCSPMWEGFMCWNKTPAGESVTQKCPDHPDLSAT